MYLRGFITKIFLIKLRSALFAFRNSLMPHRIFVGIGMFPEASRASDGVQRLPSQKLAEKLFVCREFGRRKTRSALHHQPRSLDLREYPSQSIETPANSGLFALPESLWRLMCKLFSSDIPKSLRPQH